MAVWGIGSYYKGTLNPDKTDDFIKENCAFIGWDYDNAPSLHYMLSTVKLGDIVYIKSFIPKSKTLHIKAVGIVNDVNKNISRGLGTGIGVKWKDDFEPMKIEITEKVFKNNVYNNTLFEEYDAEIINKLICELIK